MPHRAHVQCILNVHTKTCKFARGACIRHALNNIASASGRLCPPHTLAGLITGLHFVPMAPVVDPLDAKTWHHRCTQWMCCVQLMDKLCCVEVTQRLGIEGYNHCAVMTCIQMIWSCFVRRDEYDWVKDLELQTVKTPAFHFRYVRHSNQFRYVRLLLVLFCSKYTLLVWFYYFSRHGTILSIDVIVCIVIVYLVFIWLYFVFFIYSTIIDASMSVNLQFSSSRGCWTLRVTKVRYKLVVAKYLRYLYAVFCSK